MEWSLISAPFLFSQFLDTQPQATDGFFHVKTLLHLMIFIYLQSSSHSPGTLSHSKGFR